MSIKALAERILQGNCQGNRKETNLLPSMKRGTQKSFQVSLNMEGNLETDLCHVLGEILTEVDRLGRPWPRRFLIDMPAADRDQLREVEAAIDAAVISGAREKLDELLAEWRGLLLSRLN